jgi:raffinose/stachyose/melibiose transport system permease protein
MAALVQEAHRKGNQMKRNEVGGFGRIVLYIILIGFTVLTVAPLVLLLANSFKTTQEFYFNPLGLPKFLFFLNYPLAWRLGDFGTLFINSILYTTVSTVAIIFLSLAASFAFAKIKSKATPLLHGSFVIGILVTIQSLMVPLYIMSIVLKVYDTRWAVIIAYVGMGMPIGIYLCTEYIKSIPDAVVESARIDGASYFKIFGLIAVPMARPVVMTLAILNVAGVWNEFMLINMLISNAKLRSLPVGIMMFSGALASDWGKQFAALTIGLLPMVIFYLIFRNQITRGVSAGAVKG